MYGDLKIYFMHHGMELFLVPLCELELYRYIGHTHNRCRLLKQSAIIGIGTNNRHGEYDHFKHFYFWKINQLYM